MKKIPLTQGKLALVDDHWFDYLSQWKWYYNVGYAEHKENGKHLQMHRVIMNAPAGVFVDHKNGDTLDNQAKNLRLSNHSTNAMNMRKHRGVSKYKGVSKHENSWRTQIWHNNKKVLAITFPNERWAAMAYNLNAAALFGQYARLNFSGAIVGMSVDASSSNPQSVNLHTA